MIIYNIIGTYLIVGINSNESVLQYKGSSPILSDNERMQMIKSCKWVDEVVPNVPYVMNEDYIIYIIEKYNIDYIIHGDDVCLDINGVLLYIFKYINNYIYFQIYK